LLRTPTKITAASALVFAGIAAGERHALAFTTDGRLFAWGHNGYGQTGTGAARNNWGKIFRVGTLTGVYSVAGGRSSRQCRSARS
jgi:alpha-tubulin suppressor-like RCC1 family protein